MNALHRNTEDWIPFTHQSSDLFSFGLVLTSLHLELFRPRYTLPKLQK